jgi:hypothetical protein
MVRVLQTLHPGRCECDDTIEAEVEHSRAHARVKVRALLLSGEEPRNCVRRAEGNIYSARLAARDAYRVGWAADPAQVLHAEVKQAEFHRCWAQTGAALEAGKDRHPRAADRQLRQLPQPKQLNQQRDHLARHLGRGQLLGTERIDTHNL